MTKSQWAALWKRAAKRNRRIRLFMFGAILDIKIRYRDAWYWSHAWKAAAKKWRKHALELEAEHTGID